MFACLDCGCPTITLVCDDHMAERLDRDGVLWWAVLMADAQRQRPELDLDGSREKRDREEAAREEKEAKVETKKKSRRLTTL